MLRECMKETLKMMFGDVNTTTKGPHSIPLIVNDFLVSFMPLKINLIDFDFAVKQVHHLCIWLYNRKFTTIKITPI